MFGQNRLSAQRTAKVRLVKDWAREALSLPEETVVMATELQCTEPGCPPLETVIAVMRAGGGPQQFKIHKALDALVYEDVKTGAARMLRGEHPDHEGDNAPLPAPELAR